MKDLLILDDSYKVREIRYLEVIQLYEVSPYFLNNHKESLFWFFLVCSLISGFFGYFLYQSVKFFVEIFSITFCLNNF